MAYRDQRVSSGSGSATNWLQRLYPYQMIRRGHVRLWGSCLTILLGSCGEQETGPADPKPETVVDSIWVSPLERTIGVLGTKIWVGAAALAKDGTILYGTTRNPERFSWSSSAPDIATVDEDTVLVNGATVRLVRGVREGMATITATSDGMKGSMRVTVRDRARLAWSVQAGSGPIEAGSAIGADGTIYVGTNEPASDGSLWSAVSPQGAVLWTVGLPSTGSSMPAIADDGTLYLGSGSGSGSGGRLTAVGSNGDIRWTRDGIDRIRSSPAIGPDGTIHVAGERHVYGVDPQGKVRWSYEASDRVFFLSAPAVGRDGTVYVGGEDYLLYAIKPDGSLRWTFNTGGRVRSSPAVAVDGTIYFGSLDGRLYAVRPDGTERWNIRLHPQGLASSPSIGRDGTIYVMGEDVVAINPGGIVRWRYPSAGGLSTPILGADGTIYLTGGVQGLGGDAVYALDAQGRLLWESRIGGFIFGSPAISLDGRIVLASFTAPSSASPSTPYQGTLHAIAEKASANGGFAGSPWPTARGNRANNGRAGG
jgi:outer membrane protein assembly factor BamB